MFAADLPTILYLIIGFATFLVGGSSFWAVTRVFRGASIKSMAETASSTVQILQAAIDQQDRTINNQSLSITRLEARIAALEVENTNLKELATHAGSIETLTKVITDSHAILMLNLETVKDIQKKINDNRLPPISPRA